MGGKTKVEVADQSCDGGRQDKLRKRHANTGARPSSKGQRPPHLLIKPHHLTKSLLGSRGATCASARVMSQSPQLLCCKRHERYRESPVQSAESGHSDTC